MDAGARVAEAEAVASHWWFVGRRRLFAALIARLALPRDAAVLDAGTSSGTNLLQLHAAGFSNVVGVDVSAEALAHSGAAAASSLIKASLLQLPFANHAFPLALATDVLEHLDDDAAGLGELVRVVRPGGHVLLTVPAFPSLWGPQDDLTHHRRRYRKAGLLRLVTRAGLHVETAFHFNYLLFAPIWAARQALRFSRARVRSENDLNTPTLNRILSWLFTFDTATAPWLRPPFGVSLLVLARRLR